MSVLGKLKPSRGFAHIFYIIFNVILPLLVYILVRQDFVPIAFVLVILSKWRMFAVRPRFWMANIRTNATDMIVGLSVVALMNGTDTVWTQLAYTAAWVGWLIVIKPSTKLFGIATQALMAEIVGLMAVFSVWDHADMWVLVAAVGLVCFFTAHHFFYAFEEQHIRLLAYVWAYFGAMLTWILSHWLIFYYQVVAQPTLILGALSVGLGTLYYLEHVDKLSKGVRRQILFIMVTIILVLLVFSGWSDKIV